MVTASAVVAVTWVLVAAGSLRNRRLAVARAAFLVAAAQAAATVWPAFTPVAVAAWLGAGLSLPTGRLGSPGRRLVAGLALLAGGVWAGWLTAEDAVPTAGWTIGAAVLAVAVALVGVAWRCMRASADVRRAIQWVAAGAVVMAAADAVLLALHVLIGTPDEVLTWAVAALVLLPVGVLLGQIAATAQVAEAALVEAVVTAGLAFLVVAVYLVVVVGLGRPPVDDERDVLALSVIAALVSAILALPARARLLAVGRSMLGRSESPPEEVLATFGARMSRAVPFDELLLQLVESLHAALGSAGAEVWVGAEGVLVRTVSVPDRPARRLQLNDRERVVVGRTRVGGPSWLAVWLPDLLDGHPGEAPIRVAPAAHLGDLLGLLVVRRPPDAPAFSEEDDRVLVELARQVGLALHNMQLDSALQASLAELRLRNAELQASRLRIVAAADASRREIERNLHDGAQQHLVALSVKLGLAQQLLDEDRDAVLELLEELRSDVQSTIAVLRELAHGIYPPLLRNHGLDQALRSVTRRAALPCTVRVDLPHRYPEEVEAAVYFCCLEAVQNAGKHAGPGASINLCVDTDGDVLRFEVTDDGAGFDMSADGSAAGHGFVNMADRLGAIGGRLHVESSPGAGTKVGGRIPVGQVAVPQPVDA